MADIFISLVKNRRSLSEELAKELQAQGFTVWWDKAAVSDEALADTLRAELAKARAIIIILAPGIENIEWLYLQSVANEALSRGILVLLREETFAPEQIPFPFKNLPTDIVSNRSAILTTLSEIIPQGQPGPQPKPQEVVEKSRVEKRRKRILLIGVVVVGAVGLVLGGLGIGQAARAKQEEAVYRAASGSIDKLRNYANSCEICAFKSAALEEITYLSARGNLYLLRAYVRDYPSGAFKSEALAEVDRLVRAQEEAVYRAARGSIDKLRNYANSCETCAFKSAALEEITYLSARGNLYLLRAYLRDYPSGAFKSEALAEVDRLVRAQEEAVYRAARGSIDKLRNYANSCETCAFKSAALEEITYLSARANLEMLRLYVHDCTICDFKLVALQEIDRLTPIIPPNATSAWLYNDSTVYLVAKPRDPSRQFFYDTRRPAVETDKDGRLLFDGRREGKEYIGTVYRYWRNCRTESFGARGSISADEKRIVLRGRAPQKNANCDLSYKQDELLFDFKEMLPGQVLFIAHNNRDSYGGDFDRIESLELSDCELRCKSDIRCLAYTFNKWNRVCFLKDTINPLRIEPRATTGIRNDQPPPSNSSDQIIMRRSHGSMFPGKEYFDFSSSFTDCESACQRAPQCMAFNFLKSSQRCTLLSEADKYVPNGRFDSGVKTQPP